MTPLYIIISIVAGLATGYVISHLQAKLKMQELQQKLADNNATEQRLLREQHQLAVDQLTGQKAAAESEAATLRMQLKLMSEHEKQLREEKQRQSQTERQLLEEELKNMTEAMLKNAREELTNADRERLDSLLDPLHERLLQFTKAVNDSRIENASQKTELKTSFETLLKQMTVTHSEAVRQIKEQTERIGTDANNLTKALKGDSKMQGDWGEMLLEQTLVDYGLVRDEQFFLQPNYKDKQGNNLRPDAVICFPNGDKVVIDSKVSLTSYAQAMQTEEETLRQQLLKEHVQSVRKHVDELAQKRYDTVVDGSIGYVLMFIPYESGYAAAVKTDNTILHYAYKKGIIILSPANLLVTLQLTHNMWQNFNVGKNAENILQQATLLYDKFAGFAKSFADVQKHISKANEAYQSAINKLKDGKGNILSRLEKLRQLGIRPNKQLPQALRTDEDD